MDPIELTVREGISQILSYVHLLSTEQIERIDLIELDDEMDDRLIFAAFGNGKFSLAEYLAVFEVEATEVIWVRLVWNKFASYRTNAFMWRVFNNALPVDINIQRKKITLASC